MKWEKQKKCSAITENENVLKTCKMETIARSDAFVHLNRLLSLQISRCFGKCESARQIGRTLYESCSVKRCFSLCEFCCADRYLQKSKYDDIVDSIVNFFFLRNFVVCKIITNCTIIKCCPTSNGCVLSTSFTNSFDLSSVHHTNGVVSIVAATFVHRQ